MCKKCVCESNQSFQVCKIELCDKNYHLSHTALFDVSSILCLPFHGRQLECVLCEFQCLYIYFLIQFSSQYIYTSDKMSPFLNQLVSSEVDLSTKYFQIMSDYIIWILFNTSYGNDFSTFFPGKMITVGCMLIGLAYNVYILVEILNIVNIIHASRTKYFEVMNQLDAYMQKKQFPKHLQTRLKFFYMKKFRRTYFREEEILGILSGECSRVF